MDALNPAKRRAAQRPTPQRVYVKVTSEFDATGYMQPRAITWADGRTFAIDAVRDFRPAGTLGCDCRGDCSVGNIAQQLLKISLIHICSLRRRKV